MLFLFFKQKTAYEMRISDWSSDVCSSDLDLKVGDEVEVYVDRVENHQGEAMLSRDRARREAAWDSLEKEFNETARVEGVLFGRVKGGFTVDLHGAVAFLPGRQVEILPVRDAPPLMDIRQLRRASGRGRGWLAEY